MSRTVHHVPINLRSSSWNRDGGCWSHHRIDDLRYSALVEAEAARSGHRPVPKRRIHDRAFHRPPRATGNREFAFYQRSSARRNRHRDRAALGRLVREIDSAAVRHGAKSAANFAYDAMPLLTRPTRDAEWCVW